MRINLLSKGIIQTLETLVHNSNYDTIEQFPKYTIFVFFLQGSVYLDLKKLLK